MQDLDDTVVARLTLPDTYRGSLIRICRDDMLVPSNERRKSIFNVTEKLRFGFNSSAGSSPAEQVVSASDFLPSLQNHASIPHTEYATDVSSVPFDSTFSSDVSWTDFDHSTVFSYPTELAQQQYCTAPEPSPCSPSSLLPTQSSGSPIFSDGKDSLREYHTMQVQTLGRPFPARGRKRRVEEATPEESKLGGKSQKTEPVLRFACPFHKFDPATYGIHDSRWRTCVGPGWTSVHRVK